MITCTSCGTENPERARFCIECGTSLAAVCPTCGEPVIAGARFCASCGTAVGGAVPMQRPSPAAVAERRVCSILFCDLVGFTPISEARDPEAVRELLSRYFETARLVVGRYGGTVEKFIGDAVMAVWGAPAATEDDAERAVRAALELIDAVDALAGPVGVPGLAARAGVVTGEVAVTIGAVGEGMVAGDPVNTAARVQAAAAVAEVLVDDTTARLVRAAIDVEDAGGRALKGKAKDEHLWRAVRVLANVGGVQRIDGLEAPLIGRDLELRLLKDLFHTTVSRSASRMALVTGEAGSGKSRLGWEFEKYVDGLSAPVRWHRSRCLAYGEGVSFWALTEMVRQRLGIAEDDPPEVSLPLLIDGLDRFLPDPAERSFVGIRLGRLLGIRHPEDDGRDLDQSELFGGWRTWLTRLADTSPVVWVIEDLQFADSGLLDFLDHVLDWTRTTPIHLVGLARIEIDHARPGWAAGRHRQQIMLEPLDETSMARLLDALVPGMPPAAVTAVSEQAHGVPLFAVETVRSLIDDDLVVPIDGRYLLVGEVGTLAIPDSLRAVLAARLDRLEPTARDLLATAGVLGTTFSAEALAAVSDRDVGGIREALGLLVARDFLTVGADPLSPQRGSYTFTHDLLRRIAIETLSRRDRRTRHLQVAAHLRRSFSDDGEEVADVIAQHLLDAVGAVPESSEAPRHREEAIGELIRSADRAHRLGSLRRAGIARELAASHLEDSARSAELLLEASDERSGAGDQAESLRLADLAAARFTAVEDARGTMKAELKAGTALLDLGRYEESSARLEPAVLGLEQEPDVDTIRGLRALADLATLAGHDDARVRVERMMTLTERLTPSADVMALTFGSIGLMHSFAAERLQALAAYRESARFAEIAGSWSHASSAFNNMAADLVDFDPEGAIAPAQSALEYARKGGFRVHVSYATENLVTALLSVGQWDEAAAAVAEAEHADGLEDFPLIQVAAGHLAALRGDRERLTASCDGLHAIDTAEVEILCYRAHLDLMLLLDEPDPTAIIDAARIVIRFRETLGINVSPVREAWTVAARVEFEEVEGGSAALDLLAGYLPTELCPMLRAERLLAEARLADDPEPAFEVAIAAQRTDSPPHLLAHGLLDWAEHRIRFGRPEAGSRLIDEATAIAERLGAAPVAARASAVREEMTAGALTPRR